MRTPYSAEAKQQNRQLTGFSVKLDPIEIAAAGHAAVRGENEWINKNYWIKEILEDQSGAVVDKYVKSTNRPTPVPGAVKLFSNILLDARLFMGEMASKHPYMSVEQLLLIASHPRSIYTLAALAAHEATISRVMLETGDPFYKLSYLKTYMSASPEAQTINPALHCPEISVRSGKAEPSPLFKRFAPWASAVATHSLSQFVPPKPQTDTSEQSA